MKRTLAIITLVLFSQEGVSQFKLTKLAENLTAGEVASANIALNPKNTLNLVATPAGDKIYFSVDGGGTWQSSKVPQPVKDPAVVLVDGKGDFYILQVAADQPEGTRILCSVSKDGGKTWAEAGALKIDPAKTATAIRGAVDDKNNLYITWTQFDGKDSNCKSSIQFSQSSSGKKWSAPIEISQNPGDCENNDQTPMGAYPGVSHDGKVACAWSQSGHIFLDRSFDGGGFWLSNDISVASQPGGWNFVIPGLDKNEGLITLMVDRSKSQYHGSIYLVWDDQRNGKTDTDIWFIRSTNYGDNWTSALRVNDDEPGSHQYAPAFAADPVTGMLYAAYFDRRDHDDNQTDVYVAYSLDGGNSFTNVKVNEAAFAPDAKVPGALRIASLKGVVCLNWVQSDGTTSSSWTAVIKHDDLVKTTKPKQ